MFAHTKESLLPWRRCHDEGVTDEEIGVCTNGDLLIHRKRSPFPMGEG